MKPALPIIKTTTTTSTTTTATAPPPPAKDTITTPHQLPTLILPSSQTPTPDPLSSLPSSSFNINFSLPRSSWASTTTTSSAASTVSTIDDADHASLANFLRDSAHGRLSPARLPRTEMRRDKALALLGITDAPWTPPWTPVGSASVSRGTSRRTSVEQTVGGHSRYGGFASRSSSQRSTLSYQAAAGRRASQASTSESEQATPRPSRHVPSFSVAEEEQQPIPRPILKRKQSKFTEHLDLSPRPAPAKPVSLSPSSLVVKPLPAPRLEHPHSNVTKRLSAEERSLIAPFLDTPCPSPPALGPRASMMLGDGTSGLGVALSRSQSMRSPRNSWRSGEMEMCMAEAKPIVRRGSARLVVS